MEWGLKKGRTYLDVERGGWRLMELVVNCEGECRRRQREERRVCDSPTNYNTMHAMGIPITTPMTTPIAATY